MRNKILKIVGYVMLFIGIIGGLSTIDWIFSGNLAIWVLLVICFCSIGIISLSASKGMVNSTASENNIEEHEKKSIIVTQKGKHRYILLKQNGKVVYNCIKGKVVKTNHLYVKIMLTIITILLLVIAVEINDKLSEIAFEIYRK